MFLFYHAAVFIARHLPSWLTDFMVGTLIMRLGWFLNPWHRRTVYGVYRRILSQEKQIPAPAAVRKIARETTRYRGRLLTSMLTRPKDIEYARANVRLEFLPQMEQARQAGKGVILYFSDFGLFPYLLLALLLKGMPMRIPILDRRAVAHLPHGWARSFLSFQNSARACLTSLARNETVIITTIFNHLPKRLDIQFFGAPARLNYAPARLAAASGAPILPIFLIEEGTALRAVCDGPIPCEHGPNALVRTMEKISLVQERYIRRYPSQWPAVDDFWNLRSMDRLHRFENWLQRLFRITDQNLGRLPSGR